jgi:hypothetical protein
MESLYRGKSQTLVQRWSLRLGLTVSLISGGLAPLPAIAQTSPPGTDIASTASDVSATPSDGASTAAVASDSAGAPAAQASGSDQGTGDVAAVDVPVNEPAAATALRNALKAGDQTRLGQIVADPKSALAKWIDERVQGQLGGTAAVGRWDVSLTPLFAAAADVCQLRLVAHLATGEAVQTETPVRLLAAGRMQPLTSISALSLPMTAHALKVKVEPLKGSLTVTDTITHSAQAGRTYLLRLSPQLTVTAMSMNGKRIPCDRQGDQLVVTIPAGTRPGPLLVTYGGSWTAGPYDFVNPQSVLLRPESDWYPQALGPASPASFKTTLQVPGLTGLATGVPAGPGSWQPVRPVNGVALTAGKFVSKSRKVGNVTVIVNVSAASAAFAPVLLDEAAKVLGFATAKLGGYPFTTLTLCESDVAGGYGGEGLVSLGSRVLANKRARSTFLAHEIFHSWTDRLLARGTEGEIGFLSEALTTYLAYQFVSNLPGNDPVLLRQAMTLDYSRYSGQETDVSVRDAQAAAGTGPWFGVVYQKGAMVLHDLYRHLGNDRFWQVVKSLNGAFAGKAVRMADVQRVAETVAGEPLGWWFAQWTERSGAPRLALQDVQSEALDGGRYRISGRVTQAGGAYRLKLPLAVATANGVERFNLSLLRDDQPFAVTVPAAPQGVQLDPDYQILAPRRPPPTLDAAKLDQVLIVVGTQNPDADERQAAADLAKALAEPLQAAGSTVTTLADAEVTAAQLAEAPLVLLVGRPGLNQWTAKVLSLPVPLTQDRFTVSGTTYDKPSQGIVETLADVWRDGQVVTVYGGLGAPALRQMATLKLGQAPLEVVVSGESRVIDTSSYSLADPELSKRLETGSGS